MLCREPGEGPRRGCVEEEERKGKDSVGAVSRRRGRTARVRCRRGGEGPRGCGVKEEKRDHKNAASERRRRTAKVWR
eukprot:1706183-Rhodomonas_salina.1